MAIVTFPVAMALVDVLLLEIVPHAESLLPLVEMIEMEDEVGAIVGPLLAVPSDEEAIGIGVVVPRVVTGEIAMTGTTEMTETN